MIRAVARALAIFDAFERARPSLSMHEIAARIGVPKATAFRLVRTLEETGYLVRLNNQEYCLSLKILRLAGMVRSTLGIRDMARPTMARLNEESGETITLNMVVAHERVCIDAIDTPAPLMAIIRPGDHVPLLFGATGRALLSRMEPAAVGRVIAATPGGERIDRAALDAELARFRERGYSHTSGQRVPGVTAISVPLFDAEGQAKYCISLTGPAVRVDSRIDEFVRMMRAAGAEISDRLGAPNTQHAGEPP